jgi:myo-inositol-1-phosphate synthase
MTTPQPEHHPRIGVWIAGAHGDIAATLITGVSALAMSLVPTTGLTTVMPPFDRLPLLDPRDIRFGGIDVRSSSLASAAKSLEERSHTVDRDLLDAVGVRLKEIEQDILSRPDVVWDPSAPANRPPTSLVEVIEAVKEQLRAFRAKHALERVIVVNLSSVQPTPVSSPLTESLRGLEQLIADNRKDLVTSSACYAYAALVERCPYINFTPNVGTRWGSIAELAKRNRIPFCGDDGKTGETLVKTALAHMFACRNLQVMSWEGVNLLGNNDGRALENPLNREMKLRHKERVLDGILGYSPHVGVSINYVPSLGDWKTAWNLIHFRGFLGVPMTMQFIWQGCDSVLAAPLVFDLVRLVDFACCQGEYGPLRHLAVFFKSPLGVAEMDLQSQYRMLLHYAEQHLQNPAE